MAILKNAVHVAAVLTCCSLAFLVFNGSLFSYHPLFMTLSYVLVMSEGLMCGVAFRGLSGEERTRGVTHHMRVQLFGLLCAATGFACIVINKIRLGKSHFISYHAKLGLLTTILSVLAPLMGMFSFKSLGFFDKLPQWMHPRIKGWHRNAGTVTWFMALVTIELGLLHPAVDRGLFSIAWQGLVGVVGICVAFMLAEKHPKLKEGDSSLPL